MDRKSLGKDKIRLWIPKAQPDILGGARSFGNIEWTSDEIYRNLYEPLESSYPYDVKRVYLGKETSGTYDMFAWEFTPEHYDTTVYIQSGVHAIETEGYFGLARLLTLICSGEDERLRTLRDHVRFFVVPMVSVYGISRKGSRQQFMSEERYEKCLHNVLGINSNRDFYDCRLKETENVRRYFEERAEQIDFVFDFHTTTNEDWGAYLLPYPDGMDTAYITRAVQVNAMLFARNCDESIPIAYMGDESRYPTGPIQSGFMAGFFRAYHIPGGTVEHSDYIFDRELGTSVCMTRAVELYANHLLAFVGD